MLSTEYNIVTRLKIHQPCPAEYYSLVIQYCREIAPAQRKMMFRWLEASRKQNRITRH